MSLDDLGGGGAVQRASPERAEDERGGLPIFGETAEPLGWFKGPVKDVKAFKGLKFRAGGMSAEVFKAMGMIVVTLPGGEIVPALERGVIDAAEYSDPSSDMSVGFADVRKFYHLPAIHQPTGIMEILVNKKQWDSVAGGSEGSRRERRPGREPEVRADDADQNSQDLQDVGREERCDDRRDTARYHEEILVAWDKVAEKYAKENPFFAKVYASQKKWAERVVPYRAWPSAVRSRRRLLLGEENPYKVQKPVSRPAEACAERQHEGTGPFRARPSVASACHLGARIEAASAEQR